MVSTVLALDYDEDSLSGVTNLKVT